jgi:hypothetical protein
MSEFDGKSFESGPGSPGAAPAQGYNQSVNGTPKAGPNNDGIRPFEPSPVSAEKITTHETSPDGKPASTLDKVFNND